MQLFNVMDVKMDDKILEMFEFGKIQECKNIKAKLDENGISWDEFLLWIDEAAKRIKPSPKKRIPDLPRKVLKRPCPDCGNWLSLFEVNTCPGCVVDDVSKSQWRCPKCEWEEYSTNIIEVEAEPFIEDLKVVYIPMTAKQRKHERRKAAGKPCGGCEEK